jgi:hypothetical protein
MFFGVEQPAVNSYADISQPIRMHTVTLVIVVDAIDQAVFIQGRPGIDKQRHVYHNAPVFIQQTGQAEVNGCLVIDHLCAVEYPVLLFFGTFEVFIRLKIPCTGVEDPFVVPALRLIFRVG